MMWMVETSDGWKLGQGNRRVTQLQVDFQFALLLDDGSRFVLNGPFVVEVDGTRTLLDGEPGLAFGSALALLHLDLLDARALQSGELVLVFSNDTKVEVQPGNQFESWEIRLPDGSHLIGAPRGGGVIAFAPDATVSSDGRSQRYFGTGGTNP